MALKRSLVQIAAVALGQVAVAGALGSSGQASLLGWVAAILAEVVGATVFLTLVAPRWQVKMKTGPPPVAGVGNRQGSSRERAAAFGVLIGTALAFVLGQNSAAGVIAGLGVGVALGLFWWTPAFR